MRHRPIARTLSAFALVALALSAPAVRADIAMDFDLPAQPLIDALHSVGIQTDTNILIDRELVKGHEVAPLKARLTADEAIARLLDGTGLRHRFVDERTVVLAPAGDLGAALRATGSRRLVAYGGDDTPRDLPGERTRGNIVLAQAETPSPQASESSVADAGIGEITVTAQKIEQSVIEVPISMTVMSAEELGSLRVQGVEDYAVAIPNVTYLKSDRGNGPSLSIRGVSGDTGGAFSPINVTVDEIPFDAISASQLLAMRSFDPQQIDVLRGPQGTLTGANALGGIVNIVTAKPDLGGFSARTVVDVGRFETYLVQGMINTPVGDRFGLRATAYRESSEGATENIGPAGGSSSTDNWGARIAGRWLVTDAFSLDAAIGHERQKYGFNDFAYIDQFDGDGEEDPAASAAARREEVVGFYESIGGFFKNPATPWWYEGADNNGAKVALDYPERDDFEYTIASLRASYDLGGHQVAMLYGYFEHDGDTTWDADRTEYSHFAATIKRHIETHSLELRASSSYEGRLNWVAGVAWHDATRPYEEVGYSTQTVLMSDFFMPPEELLDPDDVVGDPNAYNRHDYIYASRSDLTTKAVFANVFYDFTDRLHLSVGARFTDIEARFGDLCCAAEGDGFGSDLAGRTHHDLIAGLGAIVQPDGSSEEFNPRVALNYDVAPNASLYFQFATGFRPGVGNNVRVVEENVPGAKPVADPEYMDNYELGFKGLFLGNRLNLALAVFYMDYTDLQVDRSADIPIHEGIDETIELGFTANAGKASVKGFEAEVTVQATRGLQLRAGVGHADSSVSEFNGLRYSPALEMPGVRPWNAIVTGLYETQLTSALKASFRADYRWQDEAWTSLFENEHLPGRFLPSWNTLDLSAGVDGGNWAVQAYFENVLNEDYYTDQITWSFRPTTYYIPRRFGVRFTYDFGQ